MRKHRSESERQSRFRKASRAPQKKIETSPPHRIPHCAAAAPLLYIYSTCVVANRTLQCIIRFSIVAFHFSLSPLLSQPSVLNGRPDEGVRKWVREMRGKFAGEQVHRFIEQFLCYTLCCGRISLTHCSVMQLNFRLYSLIADFIECFCNLVLLWWIDWDDWTSVLRI